MEEVYLKRVLTVSCLYFAADWESGVYTGLIYFASEYIKSERSSAGCVDIYKFGDCHAPCPILPTCNHC